jgi:hypothetical protein
MHPGNPGGRLCFASIDGSVSASQARFAVATTGHGSSCAGGSAAAGGAVMPGTAAPLHWRQVAAHAAALLLLLAPASAAAASDAGAGDLAGTAAAGVGLEAPRRQLLASGSVGAGGIAGAPALVSRHRTAGAWPHVYIMVTAHICTGLLA